jgi:hypothetical protein
MLFRFPLCLAELGLGLSGGSSGYFKIVWLRIRFLDRHAAKTFS